MPGGNLAGEVEAKAKTLAGIIARHGDMNLDLRGMFHRCFLSRANFQAENDLPAILSSGSRSAELVGDRE
jgi:hypothetical protein